MSYHVFFSFSTGLKAPITVPAGTKASIARHVAEVEETPELKRTRYKDNPVHWESRGRFDGIDDETLCEAVIEHNRWVRRLYELTAEWSREPPTGQTETITPEEASEFWHALEQLSVEPTRWTREYYRERMEHLYEVMRGREDQGVTFDERALTPKQAGAVIRLFSLYLDTSDIRLEVPKGSDKLASSDDGEYDWCSRCGAVWPDDADACSRRKCPIREERADG
ncbi:hypothetical protein ACLBYG_21100 [Methylobacterium sp. D53M]